MTTKVKSKATPFHVSDYLKNEKVIAEYLNEVIEQSDNSLLLSAIGDIAKARGISQIAKSSGLGRESLYKALTPGANPRFDTILKVIKSLGVSLQVKPLKTA